MPDGLPGFGAGVVVTEVYTISISRSSAKARQEQARQRLWGKVQCATLKQCLEGSALGS